MLDLSGVRLNDVAYVNHLVFSGYFISLYHLYLINSPLVLRDKVKKCVLFSWNSTFLYGFIQTYGTHIIVGLYFGSQNLNNALLCMYVKMITTIGLLARKLIF